MYITGDMLQKCRAASTCHMCASNKLRPVLDFGSQPHSDDFLDASRLRDFECFYPLRLVSCGDCGLLQIDYFVNPDILYRTNYVYESSTTKTGRDHYRAMARDVAQKLGASKGALAVDVGSNVGVLLQGFKEEGFSVLGVDPASHVAGIAKERGIDTVTDFFNANVAAHILNEKGSASVITGTNVFAHIHELDSAVEGMRSLLDKKGLIVIEAPYALDLIQNVEYDTIYHQHIGYLSVKPMQLFFRKHGLELFDVEPQDIHGGTLRYFVQFPGVRPPHTASVDEYIRREEEFGLYDEARLGRFAEDSRAQKRELIALLSNLRSQGKRIVGVSAPAKGNTLLNFCGIDTSYLEYITERNEHKIDTFTPGTHIPIRSDAELERDTPDYALLLAWNFATEIMRNLKSFSDHGGKFILPIPRPTII